jgi:fermentation-respiration switch protein FrsA (DUF1100 family)
VIIMARLIGRAQIHCSATYERHEHRHSQAGGDSARIRKVPSSGRSSSLPELIVRSIIIVAVAATIALGYLYVTQRSLIYFPGSTSPDAALLPADSRVLELHTADGLRLSAWFLPANDDPSASGAQTMPGPAVLICNGNAGDRSHRLPLAEALTKRGYAVLLFDYRGYAGNPGNPTEEGLRADARAATEALAAQPEVDPERIAYYGESLGSAVAGGLATERPPAALVLRSPPPSIAEVGRHHYPFLPIFDPFVFDRFPLAEQLREVRVPLLVLVTERDEIVTAELSRRVFDAATEPKRYVPLSASHHNDPALLAGDELVGVMTSFLDEWLAG